MTGRYNMTTKEIIKIDGRFIDVDQISSVSPISQYKEGMWMFEVMLMGHSNTLIFESDNEIEINFKQLFIVQHWSASSADSIHEFDFEEISAELEDDEEDDPEDN